MSSEKIKVRRLELLNKLDELERKCKIQPVCTFEVDKLKSFNPEVTCKNCPLYPEFLEIGKELNNLKEKTSKDVKLKINHFTEQEDELIIRYLHEFGMHRGYLATISKKLGRKSTSITKRMKVLAKKGLLDLD